MDRKGLDARVLGALTEAIRSGQPVSVKHGTVELIITAGKYYPCVDELIAENMSQSMLKRSKKTNEISVN
jgi:hypothetical protein